MNTELTQNLAELAGMYEQLCESHSTIQNLNTQIGALRKQHEAVAREYREKARELNTQLKDLSVECFVFEAKGKGYAAITVQQLGEELEIRPIWRA